MARMSAGDRTDMWTGLRAIGVWKLGALVATIVGAVASATWIVALEYAAQANPAVVSSNVEGLRTARDSIQVITRQFGAADARHDDELARLSGRLARTDSTLAIVRDLDVSLRRFFCRESGRTVEYCELTERPR